MSILYTIAILIQVNKGQPFYTAVREIHWFLSHIPVNVAIPNSQVKVMSLNTMRPE